MSRLKLRFYRGLVAEEVRFGHAGRPAGPRLTARTVDVNLNYRALLQRELQVKSVLLNQGRLTWPISDPNRTQRELVVEKIQARLRLLPGDEWALDEFHAAFAGADFTVAGVLTNASAIREWPLLQGRVAAAETERRLRRFADALEQIHFAARPELRLVINGDARDLQSFTGHLSLSAPDADTPWGRLTRGDFGVRLLRANRSQPARAELSLQADDAQTPWASIGGLDLTLWFDSPAGRTNIVDARLSARAASVATQWTSVTNVQFAAGWVHALTNAIPLSGHGELSAAFITTPLVAGREFRLSATLFTPADPPPADAAWAWWTNLQPYHLDWQCELSQPDNEKLNANRIACAGSWRAPDLTVTNLHADFAEGSLTARLALNVASRAARFDLTSGFDAQKLKPLLPELARRWLERFTWRHPPAVAGGGAVILPAWTNRQPDWPGEVLPTLWLAGRFAVTNGTYLGLAADWATSHFSYSNRVWHLPDLEVGRPEGRVRLTHMDNELTRNYYWRIHSTVDVNAVRPRLSDKARQGLDLVGFSQPPTIEGELWGRSHEPDRIGFRGRLTMTNFSFRGETANWVEFSARYTNRVLEFLDPRLLRGDQSLSAAGVTVDFNTQRVYFTNGFSTAEPMVVARAIGPDIGNTLAPYVFTQPPHVRVHGYAPLHGSRDADLRFAVDGGPFAWWKFKLPQVAAEVRWLGDTLTLTNVQADFYGGMAIGSAHFDFTPARGTDFDFILGLTNADLPLLLADLSSRTNRLEGRIGGALVITRANSEDLRSWTGSGRVRLRDGFLWEVPIFGVLSRPLDAMIPGVATTRFSDASARFNLASGVISTDRLEMRSPAMRLQYDGTVDFDDRVDMRVEAEPLRDAWVIGRIVSYALWPVSKLFQYRITGTLDEPRSEPVYIPKMLFLPLHPFRTLENLFNPDAGKTNAPPVYQEIPE